MVSYPSIDGTAPASYPTSYYAFSTGGARFYLLDASWGNSNTGDATGGACGAKCAMYQVDYDAHWTPTSAEYQWLRRDLAAHPGGLKFAFFHFPLRTDSATEVSDPYLDNTPGSTGSLEELLNANGVQLVFNGHAHIYQRNIATPGGVTNYVSGGGGAQGGAGQQLHSRRCLRGRLVLQRGQGLGVRLGCSRPPATRRSTTSSR